MPKDTIIIGRSGEDITESTSPLSVFDITIGGLLRRIILELKKINLHFSFLTSEKVVDDDIEDKLDGE